jgi:enoyl-CoA hydratase
MVEKTDGYAVLTMNRPDAMNALSSELRATLCETFRELQADSGTRVVILTGQGRAFTAGLDLKELSGGDPANKAFGAATDPTRAMAEFEGPIIGAINGHAITGGFEIALMCDILIASQNAIFADTHARVGLLPGWGLSQRLPRLIGISRAKEVSLSGNFVDAEQAERWGLVNRVVPPGELLDTCRGLAVDMLSCVPEVMQGYKRLIDEGYGMTFAEAMKHEARASGETMKQMTGEKFATRRKEVTQRGRTQN